MERLPNTQLPDVHANPGYILPWLLLVGDIDAPRDHQRCWDAEGDNDGDDNKEGYLFSGHFAKPDHSRPLRGERGKGGGEEEKRWRKR